MDYRVNYPFQQPVGRRLIHRDKVNGTKSDQAYGQKWDLIEF
jgi:hypothetical protein